VKPETKRQIFEELARLEAILDKNLEAGNMTHKAYLELNAGVAILLARLDRIPDWMPENLKP
jgi:hypothetical protein